MSLDAADVGALPDSTIIPSKTSQLTNDSGYITSVPVTSVNGKTGAVSLDASDVGALPSSTAIPSATSDLTNDSGFITSASVPSASSTAPAMDGNASAGSATVWARGDHVHPHDSSKQDAATSGTLTFNATSYNSQYVESLSGSWQRIGNIVVFKVTYTMKAAISSSLTHVVTNMPQCDEIIHFLSESAVNEVAARHVSVNGTSLFLAGAHTAGKTYYAGGAYLTS